MGSGGGSAALGFALAFVWTCTCDSACVKGRPGRCWVGAAGAEEDGL